MRTRSVFLLAPLVLTIVLLNACKKDCSDPSEPNTNNGIRFDSLAVGQSAKYLGLLGENYYPAPADDFVYADDTLVLKIIAQDANGYKVAESLHYVGDADPWMGNEKDSTYYYYLKVENDSLKTIPVSSAFLKSRIFTYLTKEDGLPLKNFTGEQVSIVGWETSFNYCECRQEGYTLDYQQFGIGYNRLNVLVENTFMAVDGPGETFVYSKPHGIVRFSTYGWWTQSGYGWDLLPTK